MNGNEYRQNSPLSEQQAYKIARYKANGNVYCQNNTKIVLLVFVLYIII